VYCCLTAFLKQSPFPFFNWDLYSGTPRIVTTYEIIITSLKEGEQLEPPISLHELQHEFHQDWYPQPTKIIRRFGYLVEKKLAANNHDAETNIVQDYYASMPPNEANINTAKALVENYLSAYPYIAY